MPSTTKRSSTSSLPATERQVQYAVRLQLEDDEVSGISGISAERYAEKFRGMTRGEISRLIEDLKNCLV